MTLALVSPTDSYEANAIGFIPPVTRGLVGFFLHGSAAGPLGKNYAPGGADAAVVGSPVLSARSVRFKSLTNYLQTNLPQTADLTFLTVAKSTDTLVAGTNATCPMFISNYSGPRSADTTKTSYGASLFLLGVAAGAPAANLRGGYAAYDGASGATNSASAQLALADASQFAMLAFTKSGTARKVYNKTAGTSATYDAGALVNDIATTLFRIGSGYADYAGLSDIAMTAVYNVGLTDAEVETMYQFQKAFYARNGRGIAI